MKGVAFHDKKQIICQLKTWPDVILKTSIEPHYSKAETTVDLEIPVEEGIYCLERVHISLPVAQAHDKENS